MRVHRLLGALAAPALPPAARAQQIERLAGASPQIDADRHTYVATVPPVPPTGVSAPPAGGEPPPGGGAARDTTGPSLSRARLARRRLAGMHRAALRMRAACLVSLVATAALAPAASAQQIDLISGGTGDFNALFAGASEDGSRVVFLTAEQLAATDTDAANDLYAREPNGAVTHISDGASPTDASLLAGFKHTSRDGRRVLFETPESLLPSDADGATDVYEAGPAGLRHVSDDPTGVDAEQHAILEGASADGARAFFSTSESMSAGDTDTHIDVYERGAAGAVTLMSDDDAPTTDAEMPAMFAGVSDDGSRVFLVTNEVLAASDTDNAADLYERGPGGLRHLSDGFGPDPNAPVDLAGVSSDGTHVFLTTTASLALSDQDAAMDVYERTPSGGLVHVTDGPGLDANIGATFARMLSDGTRAFFHTSERLAPSDSDNAADVYERGPGGLRHVSDGLVEPDPDTGTILSGVSSDGARVFLTTAQPLLPGDDDLATDIYERGPGGDLALVSDAGALDAAIPVDFSHASRDGGRVTFETEERLAAGDTDTTLDLYQRTPTGALLHLTDSPAGADAVLDAVFSGASADGRRVFFRTNDSLVAADSDGALDVYAATVPPDSPPSVPAPPAGEPPAGGAPDTTRPRLSRPRLARRRFAGRTVLRFTLSEPATVRLSIERALPGRRVGRSCRAPSRRNRGRRRCTRYGPAGRRTVRARAGANAVRLRGGRPGAYRLTITAVDAAGNVSRRARLPFTVVARKRRR
jgi:hypothetical protein